MEYPRRRPVASWEVGARPSDPAADVSGLTARPGQREDGGRYLQYLARMAERATGVPGPELLSNLGWVVGTEPDSPLPVRLLNRAATGGVTHPQTLALARFLIMRSVRCRRSAEEQLQLARSILRMLEQLRPDDPRPAAWLGLLYILAGRYAEARRQLGVFGFHQLGAAREALEVASLLLSSTHGRSASASAEPVTGRDPAVQALATLRGIARLADGRPEAEGTAEADVEVRAVRASPVLVRGTRSSAALSALEGELLLALLSLSWGEGHPSVDGGPWVPRSAWVGALWPLAGEPVGRLLGLFSSTIRRLRLKVHQSAGGTVIEASHKEGYRLKAGVRVRLEMDLATLAGNWLLARLPAPARW